ncbi:hypothetical protein AB0M20_12845 [Actinoplanes sp. NPDC051633]|uniref:hypothetical protein n=1 Tax=Actinoplanes sp. NPDC051633 TaxID=3155670 RepID=UPI00343CFB0B
MTSLHEAIQAGIEAALLHHERAGIVAPDQRRGLATGGPDHPTIRLSIQDVARVAARAAEQWASGNTRPHVRW